MLGRILRDTISERPVFLFDFKQTYENILWFYANGFMEAISDGLVEGFL
jgi:hypothetical protein